MPRVANPSDFQNLPVTGDLLLRLFELDERCLPRLALDVLLILILGAALKNGCKTLLVFSI